ncbi:hypothetical protein [Paraburkholderia nodosa]|uniref:hypothetical protein n=1 Tax=Paraburkholderia nodosa TaxID=392320 RepID=UPI00114CD2DF|nr:hypothetical protein [Paraburkholderia nodosa]
MNERIRALHARPAQPPDSAAQREQLQRLYDERAALELHGTEANLRRFDSEHAEQITRLRAFISSASDESGLEGARRRAFRHARNELERERAGLESELELLLVENLPPVIEAMQVRFERTIHEVSQLAGQIHALCALGYGYGRRPYLSGLERFRRDYFPRWAYAQRVIDEASRRLMERIRPFERD